LNLSFWECFLIGSVISSTDAASVFAILRSKNMNLKETTAPLLELESGSNDPMSYILVVLAIGVLQGGTGGFVVVLFFKQMIFGIAIGLIVAKIAKYLMEQPKLIADGNDTLLLIALVFTTFVIPEFIGGNSFLAVYCLGIILGNSKIKNKFGLVNFFNGITQLAQIGIFFILGLLSFPSKIPSILYSGILVFLFLTFIARPLAVGVLLLPFKPSWGQYFLVSWAGLRGVASIVFAIIAMGSGISLNYDLFHLVFLISILSVALQGSFLPFVAKKTNMLDAFSDVRKTFNDYQDEYAIKLMKITIDNNHDWYNKEVKNINFPEGTIALLIERGDEKLVPRGNTIIKDKDVVLLSLPVLNVRDDVILKEVVLDKNSKWCNKKIKDINLSKNDLIVMIKRNGENIVPNGDLELMENDLVVLYS